MPWMSVVAAPDAFARDALIAWYRGEFTAANAIIDGLCNHLRQLDAAGDYESIFSRDSQAEIELSNNLFGALILRVERRQIYDIVNVLGSVGILGLDICADIMVGDDIRRGISGGQRTRVTTGEMLVGPAKAFFMDETSTVLDSSTTFQIVKFMRRMVHINDITMVISLLQPAPETLICSMM